MRLPKNPRHFQRCGHRDSIFDEKSHQLFTLAVPGGRLVPKAGKVLSQIKDSLPLLVCQSERQLLINLLILLHERVELRQIFIPIVLEGPGHQPVVRVHLIIAASSLIRLVPDRLDLSSPPQKTKRARSPMCVELPIIATTTVPHRGGSCLHLPRNRHKNVLDRIRRHLLSEKSQKAISYHLIPFRELRLARYLTIGEGGIFHWDLGNAYLMNR